MTLPHPSTPVKWLCSYEGYHRFTNENGERYGSFDVYWHDDNLNDPARPSLGEAENNSGWYWQAYHPDCLPDGDPSGPFVTSFAAFEDANPNHRLEDVK